MIKSQYLDPAINGHGFVNHIHSVVKDMGLDAMGRPLVEEYKIEMIQNLRATSGTGGKPRNLMLFHRVIGGDPRWRELGRWQEGIDYDDASAAGSVDVSEITGAVLIQMSFGKKNAGGAMQYQSWEALIERAAFAPAIVRPASTDRPPIPIPPAGALSALYTGVYAPTDFDTPQEIATRVQKLLDAIQEQTDLLVAAGVLTR